MTVFSLLIVYSHHHPSQGDYKRVEMSSHQMQTLFECAIYFPLTGFAGSPDRAASAPIRTF